MCRIRRWNCSIFYPTVPLSAFGEVSAFGVLSQIIVLLCSPALRRRTPLRQRLSLIWLRPPAADWRTKSDRIRFMNGGCTISLPSAPAIDLNRILGLSLETKSVSAVSLCPRALGRLTVRIFMVPVHCKVTPWLLTGPEPPTRYCIEFTS